ncbi:MAG: thioredoxin-like domain-containing protein [Bacteroidota bacterium]
MRKTLYTSLLFFVSFTLSAQTHTLSFEVKDTSTRQIKVATPVNGSYFQAFNTYDFTSEHKCIIANDLSIAGRVQVICGRGFAFFIEPKNNYTIVFDVKNTGQPFTFIGENAEGQYLLNKLSHNAQYQDLGDKYLAKDSLLAKLQSAVDHDAGVETEQYLDLLKKKKIDKEFYQFALNEVHYYYGAVWSYICYTKSADKQFVDVWPILFNKLSLTDPKALTASSFYDYANEYAGTYKTSYYRKITNTVKRFNIKLSNDYLIDWYHKYADHLTEPAREYMLARFLYQMTSMKKYEPELVDLYNDYHKSYPKSSYNKYLQPNVDAIIAFHQKAADKANTENKIAANYLSINSLDELLNQHKDKLVYVDIWATWCGPCKEEFAFNKELHQFLKDKNAEIVYLSTDVDERDKDWHDMVTYYNLAGTNIRTSDKLRQDLINKLWGGKGYAIPRYLIIKNGQIVENDALRPSEKQKLYTQISKYL